MFYNKRIKYELTTHAACTASETLPALGSHQNTWHWKCWFPVSMMKANVCMSRPTPMKDKKRTRHSTNTSSSSSCTDSKEENQLSAKFLSIRTTNTYTSFIYLLIVKIANKKSLAFSLMTARVVSAILSMTGVQSSLPVEDTRLSMAPLMMSIPGDKTQETVNRGIHGCRMSCQVCMGFTESSVLPMGRDTDVIPRYST